MLPELIAYHPSLAYLIDQQYTKSVDEILAVRKPLPFVDEEESSEFEIINIIGNDEYRYGFEYNAQCIVSEWLYKKSLKTNKIELIEV